MDIIIKAIELNEGLETQSSIINLPEIDKVKKIIECIFNNHPFNTGIHNNNLSILIKVLVGGKNYYKFRPNANMKFDSFIKGKENKILLNMHLARYMGDIKPYTQRCPKPVDLINQEINWQTLKNIIYHEFGHFFDATNSEFQYDKKILDNLGQLHYELYINLWNAYINRRLYEIFNDKIFLQFSYIEKESDESIASLIDTILQEKNEYNMNELIKLSTV